MSVCKGLPASNNSPRAVADENLDAMSRALKSVPVVMKRLSILLSVLTLATHLLQAQAPGFLHARNARILNGQEQEIILRGMGVGGWMLQEGYMLGVRNDGTQHSI